MQKIDAEKVQKYQDAINEAIRIHTKKATESLPYNKSELVEIVDITERNLGKYIVWNGSTRYYAYSENTTYDIGMKVYVNIPNSDFAAQKTIIGQYVAEGEKSVVWINPLDVFQPLPDINLLEDTSIGEYENKEYSLLANWNKENSFPEDKNEFPRSQEKVLFDSEGEITSEYQGHTYLGITADFKTRLETFSPIDGDYGLRLELRYRDKVSVLQDEVEKTRIYTLSAKNDMIGNVYNYRTYFTQASLFDISDIENIAGIKLSFFQDGDFRRNTNKWIPVYYSLGQEGTDNYREYLLQDNIFVKDIKIKVGDDLISKNDKLKIKTLQGLTYSTTQNDALNYKNIELEWDHLDPDLDKFEILDKDLADEKIVNYKIHWYRDAVITASEPVVEVTDEVWERFKNLAANERTKEKLDEVANEYKINLISGADYTYNGNLIELTAPGQTKLEEGVAAAIAAVAKKRQESSMQIDNLAGKGWQSLGDGKNFNYNYFLPDTKKSYSKVMAIVEYNINSNTFDTSDPNYVVVKSNVLEFTNEAMTSNPLSDDKNSALQITCEDGSNGDYPIYSGITGQLLSRTDVSLVRNFKATCKSLYDGSDYLTGDETIIWQIPKRNTMIVVNDSFIEEGAQLLSESPNEEIEYDDNYYFIARSSSDGVRPVLDTQQYQIAQFFNKACVNNTIYCYIIKNNEVFKASRTLTFNQHGTSGTDYTFTLGFKQKIKPKKERGKTVDFIVVGPADTALTMGDENYLEIDFQLFNSKNEEIELTEEQKSAIIGLWIAKASSGYYSGQNNANNGLEFEFLKNENYYTRVAVRVKEKKEDGSLIKIEDLNHIVLQATVSEDVADNNLGKIQFTQLLPIHIRAEGTNYVLNGSDYIIYDDKGANPSFYNDKYELIGVSEGVEFEIKWDPDTNESSFYPFFDGKKLVPTPLYINDIGNEIWIDCYQNIIVIEDGEQITEKKLLYTFPLIILQNKYQIPAINQWNGELVVDSNGNKVLAAMIGAGHKDRYNTFSGVLMGDIEQEDPRNPGTKKADTGLFGYDEGTQTFGFNIDGHAFIGASGNGRIYIDGNTGRIISAAREAYENQPDNDLRGTEINLKDNYIDIQGAGANNQAGVHMDTRGSITTIDSNNQQQTEYYPYLSVTSRAGNKLLHVGDDGYYLQTDDYIGTGNNKSGLKIDLENGSFTSYDKLTINGAVDSQIYFGETNNHVKLGLNNSGSFFEMKKAKIEDSVINNYRNQLNQVYNNLKNIIPNDYQTTSGGQISNLHGRDNKYNLTGNFVDYFEDLNFYINSEIENDNFTSLYEDYQEKFNLYNQYNGYYQEALGQESSKRNEINALEIELGEANDLCDYYDVLQNQDASDIDELIEKIEEDGEYYILFTDEYTSIVDENTPNAIYIEDNLSTLESKYEEWNDDETPSEKWERLNTAYEKWYDLNEAYENYEEIPDRINEIRNLLAISEDLVEQERIELEELLSYYEEIIEMAEQNRLEQKVQEAERDYNAILKERNDEEIQLQKIKNFLQLLNNNKNDIEGRQQNAQDQYNYWFNEISHLNSEIDSLESELENLQDNTEEKLDDLNNNCRKDEDPDKWDYEIARENWELANDNYQNQKNIKNNYDNMLEKYNMALAGQLGGSIIITNIGDDRIKIDDVFKVDANGNLTAKGEIKADSGYLNNVTVQKLKFQGPWKDNKGTTHSEDMEVVPKWMTFVTDVEGMILKGYETITAKVHNSVTVNGTAKVSKDFYEDVTLKGAIGTVRAAESGAPPATKYDYTSSNMTISAWKGGAYHQTDVVTGAMERIWYKNITVSGVAKFTGSDVVDTKVSVPYEATWTGKTNAPVIKGIKLKVTTVKMWALTNLDTIIKDEKEIPIKNEGVTAEKKEYDNF